MKPPPLIIVMHGPSGVGKDSVIDELRKRHGIHRATSSTDRRPRKGERSGNHYHFLSHAEFMEKAANGDFIEWAEVYGDLKGLEWCELEGPLSRGEDVIIRTDVQGARTWRKKLSGAIYIFLTAEDKGALRDRLDGRDTEDEASLKRRAAELEAELADASNNDYIVHNRHGELEATINEVARIIETERLRPGRPAASIIA